jgi:hemoglobin-like flavoprotein
MSEAELMNSSLDRDAAFNLVAASYQRARASGELFETFYRLFLNKSPDIPPMFARTDFPHQKLMLRESLLELLTFSQTGAGRAEIERLAERHRSLNVQPRHYELWLDALREALEQHDPAFTPQLAQMWRDLMRPGIELMTAGPRSQSR